MKESVLANNLSLKEYLGLDIYIFGDMETVRFFTKYKNGNPISISFDIPFYDKHYPEKLEATKYNLFNVFEYTKRDAHTSKEIDWNTFKEKFKESVLNLAEYCA